MTSASSNDVAPIVSVLFPVYNAQSYVNAAVDSILCQTFRDFELLALDDGSTDQSRAILNEYAAKDARMRVISRANRGLVATLNELIAISRGRYLARMDADDISLPQRFEKQVEYLQSHPECVVVGTKSLAIDSEGLPIREFVDHFTHDQIDSALISAGGDSRMCHPSIMMRKDAVVQIGHYRDEYRFAEDLDLFLRLAEIGKLANLPEVLILYRLHPGSVCQAHREEQRASARRALEMAYARRGIPAASEASGRAQKPETVADSHRKWAWWALSAGNLMTARKHAIKALAREPLNIESLRVVACAIRGH